MPSKSALIIASKVAEFLARPVTEEEQDRCEEIALNFYTNATCRYIDGLIKKNAKRDFSYIYVPIMNGVLRGAYRRMDLIYLKDRMKAVYDKVLKFCGDGLQDKELEAIIFMAEDCSDKEIDAAIQAARIKGVHHASYIKAIIDGNRRIASQNQRRLKASMGPEFVPDEHIFTKQKKKVPVVGAVRQAWKDRLKQARKKLILHKARLNEKKRDD